MKNVPNYWARRTIANLFFIENLPGGITDHPEKDDFQDLV